MKNEDDTPSAVTFSAPSNSNRKRKAAGEIRTQNLYNPESEKLYPLSRSKLDLFIECPHCFYLDRRLGLNPPSNLPFTLNSAVDALLKKEFDDFRKKRKPHPLMVREKIDAIPFRSEHLTQWRDSFEGIRYHAPGTNFVIFGAVDDLWQDNKTKEIIVVDYKATAVNKEVIDLNEPWHERYKRQVELYQWLIRHNGFKVADTAYFVYCNGQKNLEKFNANLYFKVAVISHTGNHDWIEPTIKKAYECLQSDEPPPPSEHCELCNYSKARNKLLAKAPPPLIIPLPVPREKRRKFTGIG